MNRRTLLAAGGGLAVAAAISTAWALSEPSEEEILGLRKLGPATDFTLPDERGGSVTLSDLRGKVVLVNFMFTRCYDICPILTSKLAVIQDELGERFGRDVHFVSITVDPEYDRPDVLREFAEETGYNPDGWSFLTGETEDVRKAANAYGVFLARASDDYVNHSLLTTVVDREGIKRVQYLGEKFDHMELYADVASLIDGKRAGL